jgi:hypothetical protein
MFASNDLFLQRLERNAEKSLNDSCLPFQLPLRFLGQLSHLSNAAESENITIFLFFCSFQ